MGAGRTLDQVKKGNLLVIPEQRRGNLRIEHRRHRLADQAKKDGQILRGGVKDFDNGGIGKQR